ncbi:hypothetical protein [Acidisphaera sp. S103]|uniref:hypothetical protein n=1 Tax=Acidisphaera sp. S103 TaxID=1747223 RepID=UPI00131D5C4E|nr:hypothetical protein [Acidisphaera sp. S103]
MLSRSRARIGVHLRPIDIEESSALLPRRLHPAIQFATDLAQALKADLDPLQIFDGGLRNRFEFNLVRGCDCLAGPIELFNQLLDRCLHIAGLQVSRDGNRNATGHQSVSPNHEGANRRYAGEAIEFVERLLLNFFAATERRRIKAGDRASLMQIRNSLADSRDELCRRQSDECPCEFHAEMFDRSAGLDRRDPSAEHGDTTCSRSAISFGGM